MDVTVTTNVNVWPAASHQGAYCICMRSGDRVEPGLCVPTIDVEAEHWKGLSEADLLNLRASMTYASIEAIVKDRSVPKEWLSLIDRVRPDGTKVRYRTWRFKEAPAAVQLQSGEHTVIQAVTEATISYPDHHISVGYAFCAGMDQFDKWKGRLLAEKRARRLRRQLAREVRRYVKAGDPVPIQKLQDVLMRPGILLRSLHLDACFLGGCYQAAEIAIPKYLEERVARRARAELAADFATFPVREKEVRRYIEVDLGLRPWRARAGHEVEPSTIRGARA